MLTDRLDFAMLDLSQRGLASTTLGFSSKLDYDVTASENFYEWEVLFDISITRVGVKTSVRLSLTLMFN